MALDMEPVTNRTTISASRYTEQYFRESDFVHITNSTESQIDRSRMSRITFEGRVHGSGAQTYHDMSVEPNGGDRASHFGHFGTISSNALPNSSDFRSLSAPWYQFHAPGGVVMNSTMAPVSPQTASSLALDSYSDGDLTRRMNGDPHSSTLSLPTGLLVNNEYHNISDESLNPIRDSKYENISTSSPEIRHDLVRVNDVLGDSTWNNIFFDAAFDQGNVSSRASRVWTPKNDISTIPSSDVSSSGSWARVLDRNNENPELASTAIGPTSQLHLLSVADINARSASGQTIFHYAAQKGHLKVAQLLLDAGANLSIQDIEGKAPLHLAAAEGHSGVVRLLLTAGVDINAVDIGGRSALHLACERKHLDVVMVLVGKGVQLNARSASGLTPLHCAAESGCDAVVRLLLERGADANAKSDST